MRTVLIALISAVVPVAAACAAQPGESAPVPDRIEFNRDVQPILANDCFACHGPDSGTRKADLRLDKKEGLFTAIKGKSPVVPGHPDQSELFRRITATDPDERMPDPRSNKKLSPRQVAVIKKWIEQGASWQGHWAFTPPVRPQVPQVADRRWGRNPIDAFVLSRLQAEGLKPSAEADKTTLIRRLTLDLTGLPPTPKEVDEFLADTSPDAYDKLVDRLMANPHYGERMALDWLDAARYADTHGYHIDSGRDMTRWRDWVINAFNENKPFDQFAVEQLAGDLLPHATVQQKIASGFSRNSMINFEGGAIPEEYLTAYLIDRVSTTGTVFMGLTVGCAQCHDHKFDPITQKDFYQLYAFFNGIAENGLDGQAGNAVPLLKLPTPDQQNKLDALAASIKDAQDKLAAPSAEADAAQAAWEKTLSESDSSRWTVVKPASLKAASGATFAAMDDGSVFVEGPAAPTDTYTVTFKSDLPQVAGIRVEALADQRLKGGGPGRSANGNFVLTGVKVTAAAAEDGAEAKPGEVRAASADFSQDTFPVSGLARLGGKGWAIFPQAGKSHAASFELAQPVMTDKTPLVTLTLEFNSHFSQHAIGRLRISVIPNPVRSRRALPPVVAKIVAVAPEKRTPADATELRNYYRGQYVPEFREVAQSLTKLKKQRDDLDKQVPSTMVMQEMPKPRDTFILIRGQYDQHGEKVSADVPAALPPLAKDAPRNRLGLAKWIVDPGNPLTARVTVNRLWQTFFGTGIVKTPGDFGTQGDVPSHPELLDWLAVQFRDGEGSTQPWDVKALVRLMVTSSAYRQASRVTPEMAARDPEDRLLDRSPRFRLNAEFIRDQALAVSGLLNDQIGGTSVFPYQPPGLWEELMSRADGAKWTAQTYTQSHGKDLYRRGMYTFWKRTSPPPTLSTFDAPDREVCTVRRSRTNTPLQALVLWNDPTYVEASRKMAERVMTDADAGDSIESRLTFAFRLATARVPSAAEVAVLKKVYASQLDGYRNNAQAAEKLLAVGEAPRNGSLDQSELAAWTMVCSTVLNLDETVTRG